MKIDDLLSGITLGEDSTRQFKANVKNNDALASEMAAFSNSEGGTIYIGVENDGSTPGLTREDVARINQLISNAASQHVRSPLAVQTENVRLPNRHIVIVLTVPKGIDKPTLTRTALSGSNAGRTSGGSIPRRSCAGSSRF